MITPKGLRRTIAAQLPYEAPDVRLREQRRQRAVAERFERALHRFDDVAPGRGRQRQEASGGGARNRGAHRLLDHGVEREHRQVTTAARELVADRPPQMRAHELGEIERIFLGVCNQRERFEDLLQVAHRKSFFDEPSQDVGELRHRDRLRSDARAVP